MKKLSLALLLHCVALIAFNRAEAATPLPILVANGHGLCYVSTPGANSISVCPAAFNSIGGVSPGQNVNVDSGGVLTVPGVYRGAFATTTFYLAGDLASYLGVLYSANTSFTSASAFNASNWTAVVTPSSGSGSGSTTVTFDGRSGATITLQSSDIASLISGLTQAQIITNFNLTGAFDASGAANTAQGNSLQKSANLSDLASAATARTNLGLTTVATASFGTASGQVADGGAVATSLAAKAAVTPLVTANCNSSQAMTFGSDYDLTLTGNCTLTLTGATAGGVRQTRVFVRQSGSGGYTLTLPTPVKWLGGTAPTPNTSAAGIDQFSFRTPDAGTTVFGGN